MATVVTRITLILDELKDNVIKDGQQSLEYHLQTAERKINDLFIRAKAEIIENVKEVMA